MRRPSQRIGAALLFATGLAWLTCAGLSAQTDAPAIAFGTKHAVALRNNGDVLTWGDNVSCQLGRTTTGNVSATPTLVLRNAKEIAVASDHNLALMTDGQVYGWGANATGALGTGDTNEQCDGPALVTSLAGKSVVHIATGLGFSVAVTAGGDVYCSGDNDMSQCPVAKGGRITTFALVTIPELSGKVVAVRSGSFHTLALTRDGKLYAFGRGRDGQLGDGRSTNGFAQVHEMTDVVSFAAGTWHSVAARADGSVWMWGNNAKSQLCDGSTVNHPTPIKLTFATPMKMTQVIAGSHATLMRASDGTLYGCGDNQFAPLGADKAQVLSKTTTIASATSASGLAVGGYAGAFSTDGCAVRIGGSNEGAVVSATGAQGALPFSVRAALSLCAPKAAAPLANLVREAPRGGTSGCWTPRVDEDAAKSPKFAPLREAMIAAERILKKNAALLESPVPVRFRTSMSAGPYNDSGARLHVKAAPERKMDGTRLWTGECDVIPQLDRIGGAIAQVSIFFNNDARGQFIGAGGEGPKLTGRAGGYPEYNGWVLITKDGRLPWMAQTLADKLDVEGARRKKAAASNATPALAKQVKDYEQYRASFTAEQLRAPAVWGDPSGAGKTKLNAQIEALQALTADEQRQVDDWSRQSRALELQARVETTSRNPAEATRLRAQANDLAMKVRTLRERHLDDAAPLMQDVTAQYDLTNLQPGPADRAIGVKPDPAFPDFAASNRIQVIIVMFSVDSDPAQTARRAWQQRIKDTFDFAALAALLK